MDSGAAEPNVTFSNTHFVSICRRLTRSLASVTFLLTLLKKVTKTGSRNGSLNVRFPVANRVKWESTFEVAENRCWVPSKLASMRSALISASQKSIIFRTDGRTDERKVWIKPLPTYIALRAITLKHCWYRKPMGSTMISYPAPMHIFLGLRLRLILSREGSPVSQSDTWESWEEEKIRKE